MTIILEGSKIANKQDFHQQLKVILELPDYYGGNLDALWDCLTAWVNMPMTLVWEDFAQSKAVLGDYFDKCVSFFQKSMEEINGFIIKYM
jgi:ribonuclease inhibitor